MIVYSTVHSGAFRRKHQSSASLAFVRGNQRRPVNSPLKGPVTRKMFPSDDVIMGVIFCQMAGSISLVRKLDIVCHKSYFGKKVEELSSYYFVQWVRASYFWNYYHITTEPANTGNRENCHCRGFPNPTFSSLLAKEFVVSGDQIGIIDLTWKICPKVVLGGCYYNPVRYFLL